MVRRRVRDEDGVAAVERRLEAVDRRRRRDGGHSVGQVVNLSGQEFVAFDYVVHMPISDRIRVSQGKLGRHLLTTKQPGLTYHPVHYSFTSP